MPWNQAWSGAGVLVASSVQVVGTTTEIDINAGSGLPGEAFIIFSDVSGNNAPPATIGGPRDVLNNSMGVGITSGEGSTGLSSSIQVNDQEVNLLSQLVGSGNRSQITTRSSNVTIEADTTTNIGQLIVNPTLITVNIPIVVASETWHDVSLLNGWTERAGLDHFMYRMDPDGYVTFRGTVAGGTSTNGTQIGAALPIAYRPAKDAVMAISSDNLPSTYSSANGSPRLQLQASTGDLYIYGTGPGPLYFDCSYSLFT